MERTAQKFSSYQQAEEASRLYYQRLSPAKRLEILLQLIDRCRAEGHASSQGLERVYRIAKLSSR
jgi:hypothetical protein